MELVFNRLLYGNDNLHMNYLSTMVIYSLNDITAMVVYSVNCVTTMVIS